MMGRKPGQKLARLIDVFAELKMATCGMTRRNRVETRASNCGGKMKSHFLCQICQMIDLVTKNLNVGLFLEAMELKIWAFLWPYWYFQDIRCILSPFGYILLSFGTSFPILVFFNEKYLATLTPQIRTY
jgi:hypothetical protein